MAAILTVEHKRTDDEPFYVLDHFGLDMPEAARRRALNYVLDYGGRSRILDRDGKVLASFPEKE